MARGVVGHATTSGDERAMSSDAGRWRLRFSGIVLCVGQPYPCTLAIAQMVQHGFALDARRLAPRPLTREEPPALRLRGSDTLPVHDVLRLTLAAVTGRRVAGDADATLIALSVAPTIDPTIFIATLRLWCDPDVPSDLHLRFHPPVRRPVDITWTDAWSMAQWLQAVRRATARWPRRLPRGAA
jgi:hypothetical protein